MAYAILRMEKIKSVSRIEVTSDHMSRSRPVPNANPRMTSRNLLLVGSGNPADDFKNAIDGYGIDLAKLPGGKNAPVLAYEIFMGASPEFFHDGSPEQTREWAEKSVQYLKDKFGAGNVCSAIVHMDESTPHITALVVPVDSVPTKKCAGPHLNAKKWTGPNNALSLIQDEYAEAMAGFGLERGIKGSKASHVEIAKYYAAVKGHAKEVASTLRNFQNTLPEPPGKWTLLTNPRAVEDYVDEVTARVRTECEERHKTLLKLEEVEKRKNDLEKTTAVLSKKTERYRKIADDAVQSCRDIPLDEVLTSLGIGRDPKDKNNFKCEGHRISRDKTDAQRWYDHETGRGGYGSIDLVMHVNGCSFKEALSFLGYNFSVEDGERAFRAKAGNDVQLAVQAKPPYAPPTSLKDPDSLETVRKFLYRRGLSPQFIDYLTFHNLAFPVMTKGFVNVAFSTSPFAAEIKGVDSSVPFKGLHINSTLAEQPAFAIQQSEDPQTLVLCESALDAISYAELHPKQNLMCISTSGARPTPSAWIRKNRKKYKKIICAYDRDETGKKCAESLKKEIPRMEIDFPDDPQCKDWNDMLPKPPDLPYLPDETLEAYIERQRLMEEQIAAEEEAASSLSDSPF